MGFNPFTKRLQPSSTSTFVAPPAASAGNQLKLKAGLTGDWVNGDYIGATSGALTGDVDGQKFSGLDVFGGNYYIYERINGIWSRTQKQ